jgi:ribonuclease P protein component
MHFSVDTKTACVLRESGLFVRHGAVYLRYLPGDVYRYSPVLSKRQGSSVQRNRIKRVVREILRKDAGINPKGLYLVFIKGECSSLNRNILARDIGFLMNALQGTPR